MSNGARTPRWPLGVAFALLTACEAPPEEDAPGTPDAWQEGFAWSAEDPIPCPSEPGPEDRVDGLLDALGLDRGIRVPRSLYEAAGGNLAADPTRLELFHEVQEDPHRLPCHAGNMAARADASAGSERPMTALVADAVVQLELELSVGGPTAPLDEQRPLLAALAELNEDEDWDEDAVAAAADRLPLPLRRAAGRILLAAAEATELRDEALEAMSDPAYAQRWVELGSNHWLLWDTTDFSAPGPLNPDGDVDRGLFLREPEGAGRLYRGAVVLTRAIDESGPDLEEAAAAGGEFELLVPTPLGTVLLRGAGDDEYDPSADPRLAEPLLLVIDTGGDDVVRTPAGGTNSGRHPVSVHIDLGGSDFYGYVEADDPEDREGLLPSDAEGRTPGWGNYGPFSVSTVGRQGAGLLGYGVLWDRGEGDDTYLSLRRSQGFGNFGVGILRDEGGHDRYETEQGSQGAAIVGVGLLVDEGGDDSYRSYRSSQGFGFVSSFGMLWEGGGADDYELVVDDIVLFDSPQTPGTANSSLGQGCAFGWRRDQTGTHLGGGLALLRDRAGDDAYEGSTFVQGSGYWMGLGVLADAAGDDTYHGVFYAQGATAHFANAAFLEGDGDDRYNPGRRPNHSAIGLAHDWSVTVFVDDAGRDAYFGTDRSIGASKCHGLSIFADNGGDDVYDSNHDRSIGWATDYDWAPGSCGNSTKSPSYGLFVDVGGADTYLKPSPEAYGDDRIWISDDPDDPTALELGGGIDAPDGASGYAAYGAAWERRAAR